MNFLKFLFGRKPQDPWDDQRELIRWSGIRNTAPWTIVDSFEGVQVFGDIGSGKSSASAKMLASAFLRAGYGGLVLTVKAEDGDDWKKLLEENGRAGDGIFFGPGSGHCFNFLQYELDYGAQLGLGSLNAARILSEMVSLAQQNEGRVDDFWTQAANQMIAHTLEVIRVSGKIPSLKLAKEIIESAPRSLLDVEENHKWKDNSVLWLLLNDAKAKYGGDADFKLAENYWLKQFPQIPEKTRSSIVATFTASVAQHFCPNMIHELFGEDTNVTPDDIANGKIIVVNLPVKTYGAAGRFAGIIWKYCAQLAIERRRDRKRPVFIFVDESHYFLTGYDQLFQTTARSSRCSVVYLTQNLSNYYAFSPGNAGKHRVDSMCNCLKTKILHQCSHPETRQMLSDAVGKYPLEKTSQTVSHGKGSPQYSETKMPAYDYWVHPDRATRLKTGGFINKHSVEGIVYKAGKTLGRRPFLLVAEFDQKNVDKKSLSHCKVAVPKTA